MKTLHNKQAFAQLKPTTIMKIILSSRIIKMHNAMKTINEIVVTWDGNSYRRMDAEMCQLI